MSSRRGSSLYGFIGLTIIGALMSTAAPASACESVDLFKIVTVRDETIVGVTEQDYAALQGHDVSAIGRALVDHGAYGTGLALEQIALRAVSYSAMERVIITGNGDVIQPEDDLIAIGSGGPFAQAAARALLENTQLDARSIVEKGLHIAGDICVFTNQNHTIETLEY